MPDTTLKPSGNPLLGDYQLWIRSPASPSCLDRELPTHITRHNTVLGLSSPRMSSTVCPRLRREVPVILKPPCELSRIRHGILCARRPRSTIRLARCFNATRFDRRCSEPNNTLLLCSWIRCYLLVVVDRRSQPLGPLYIEMRVTCVTVVWFSAKDPEDHCIDNASPWPPIDRPAATPGTVSL
jgi:hypothetical protein